DPNTRRWWLQYGDEVVGYWPPEILNYLKQNAKIVQWGGDVYSKNMKGVKPHTTTAMGSGEYASGLLGEACFIENVRILDYSLQVKYPESVHSMAEEPDCYSSLNYQKSLAYEPMFYFGGPGREKESMGKRMTLIFLFVIALLVLSSVNAKAKAENTLYEVDMKLKLLNKPAIKSIKMRPSINFPLDNSTSTKNESSLSVLSQTWHKSGSCPKGTIPIRRIRRQELLRAASLEHFGREGPQTSSLVNTTNDKSNPTVINVHSLPNHSTAYLLTFGHSYIGIRADINIWSPRVESPDEYTTPVWLRSSPGNDFESIEAGWMLDGYQKTGCINLICSGFVQTSQTVAIGASVQPVSKKQGKQYGITIRINKDPNTEKWYLNYGDEVVGYWPYEILYYLKSRAIIAQWGGDVYSKNTKGVEPHTTTAMGSGEFSSGLWGSACFVQNVYVLDTSFKLYYPDWGSGGL
ncbi:hypothetical protein CFP56_036866, partial [Quercus suber]